MGSEQDFVNAIVKTAGKAEDNEDSTLKGEQKKNLPELLQPDDGPGEGARAEFEAFSQDAEKRHKENREGGYLQEAFDNFDSAAKETGQDLKEVLDGFGPDAIVSRATAKAGATKISSATVAGFIDELGKIRK